MKDLLDAPYDADIAAAVEGLKQSMLRWRRNQAELKKKMNANQTAQETLPLKGFEDEFERVMNQQSPS